MNALYKGFVVSAIASLAILYPVTDYVIGFTNEYTVNNKTFNGMNLYYCGVIGLITGLLIWITEYYTGTNYRPVKSVAASSTTGHGTNVIQGLAISMEATAIPALIIVGWNFINKLYCWSFWNCYCCYYNACFSWNGCCFRCLWSSN